MVNVTTLARVKAHGAFNTSETQNDSLINDQLIPAMTTKFIQAIEQEIDVELRTVFFDVYQTRFKFLTPVAPIHLVTELVNDASHDFDNTTAIDIDAYRVKKKKGNIVFTEVLLTPGFEALRCKYLGGLALKIGDFISQLNDPPATPSTGDTYLVGTAPTGAWVANTTDLATWNGASWGFKTQQARFLEVRADLALAADIQINFEFQRRKKLGTNYNAIRSHVRTFNQFDFLPEVQATIDKYTRRLFTDDE